MTLSLIAEVKEEKVAEEEEKEEKGEEEEIEEEGEEEEVEEGKEGFEAGKMSLIELITGRSLSLSPP